MFKEIVQELFKNFQLSLRNIQNTNIIPFKTSQDNKYKSLSKNLKKDHDFNLIYINLTHNRLDYYYS